MTGRIEVLKQLTLDAAKEVTEKAPGQFPHLEKMLEYLNQENALAAQRFKMECEWAEASARISREYYERQYDKSVQESTK